MKNFFLLILLTIGFFISCKSEQEKVKSGEIPKEEEKIEQIPYSEFKEKVQTKKLDLINHPQKDISDYFFSLINYEIYQYWDGTPWDFNGTSQIPKDGEIACGYFITNTLTDLGFKINRIKLAQEPSSKMINELCMDIKRFSKIEQLENYLDAQPDNSVFIFGLDFHTGYILKDSTNYYFLHSNYIKNQGVMKEKLKDSKALAASNSFMIGNLTSNEKLMTKWVYN